MKVTKQQLSDWGRIGGHVRALKLSSKRRSEIASKAVAKREANRKKAAA